MNISMNQTPIHAYIMQNLETQEYVIYSYEKDGPIITGMDKEETKKRFETALKLACAIRNLFYFEGASKLSTQKKLRNDSFSRVSKISYHEVA